MVVLDTCIIIDHLRQTKGHSLLRRFISRYSEESLALSVVSVQELYQGRSTRDSDDENFLLSTISPLRLLPYNFEVAQTSGILVRDLSRPIGLADAAIAATAILNDAKLLTLDKKDFLGIKELQFWKG